MGKTHNIYDLWISHTWIYSIHEKKKNFILVHGKNDVKCSVNIKDALYKQ